MSRIHAFEWNDTARAPRFLRDAIVEALGLGLRWGHIYDEAGKELARFLERSRADSVLDLCTGTGEPVSIMLGALSRAGAKAPRFLLSDLFPNVPSMERIRSRHPEHVEIVRESVDATAVPPAFDRPARTVFSAFHHFSPDLARKILADTVAKRRAIFILEGFPRSLLRLLPVIPWIALGALANPWIAGRGRLAKIVFTYLIPLVPLAGAWDAVVSVLRVYSETELRALVEPLGGGYAWEYREVRWSLLGRAVVFTGTPTSP
ncbi:hypothetical protein HY251_18740 [bacterium]|nr:hypothetical protein [bacterium]